MLGSAIRLSTQMDNFVWRWQNRHCFVWRLPKLRFC